jgi:hypothetical protein
MKKGDPRHLINDTNRYLATHKYVYMGMAGDQHWTVDPNWPASIQSNCTGDCHARFLLAVEVTTPALDLQPALRTRCFRLLQGY